MKLLFLPLLMFLFQLPDNSTFYDCKFESIQGTMLKTADYAGKKVVIAVVSVNEEGLTLARFLDSVQNASDSIQVVMIPTGDFSGNTSNKELKERVKGLHPIITKPLKVKKDNASMQHPLFAWLTQANKNHHFDMDVTGEGQVFMISENGTLYSVLPKGAPLGILAKAINQPFNE